MDLGISKNVAPLLEEVRNFIVEEIYPVEQEFMMKSVSATAGSLPTGRRKYWKRSSPRRGPRGCGTFFSPMVSPVPA